MSNNEELAGLVVKLAMEDGTFQEGIQNLNRQMRIVDSEFKAAVGNTKTFGDSLDGLKANADRLTSAIEIQTQLISKHQERLNNSKQILEKNIQAQEQLKVRLDDTRRLYEESILSVGKNSEETKKLKVELDKLQKSYDGNNQKIRNNVKTIENQNVTLNEANGKLKSMQGELDKTTKAIDTFDQEIKSSDLEVSKATGGVSALNVAFGTLVADGVRKAINALGDFIKAGLDLNSNLQEVENVIGAVFGSNGTAKVEQFAKTARDEFGLAEIQVKEFTGTMGAMLDSAGIASNKALNMSISFTKLSGDMASFFNSSPEKVFQDLTSAMAGSSETMLKYGINMNITNLEQYALNKGINQSWKEMSQAEQQMLRYNYIMDKTSKAQGDFSKTSDSHANQQRILKLRLQETSAILAEKLLPVITDMTSQLVDFLENNEGAISNIANLISMVANAVAVMFSVLASVPAEFYMVFGTIALGVTIFNQVTTAINATSGAINIVSGAFQAGANPILKWTIIITGAVAAVTLLVAALNVLFGKSGEMERTMNSMSNSINSITGQVNTSMSQVKVPQYAKGTQFHAGGLALVGERGPEIVNLPRGTAVTPTEQTKQQVANATVKSGPIFTGPIYVQANNVQEFVDAMKMAVMSGELA